MGKVLKPLTLAAVLLLVPAAALADGARSRRDDPWDSWGRRAHHGQFHGPGRPHVSPHHRHFPGHHHGHFPGHGHGHFPGHPGFFHGHVGHGGVVIVTPRPHQVWVPGYWGWNGYGWVWVPGYWTW